MQLDRPRGQMSDSFLMSAFIILSGGLQDAYTYCCRDKVFANAQTGNIVLMSTHLCRRLGRCFPLFCAGDLIYGGHFCGGMRPPPL